MDGIQQFIAQNKKVVAILCVAVLAIIIGSIVYHFATTEQVTIRTNNPEATIALTTIESTKPKIIGKGSASLRLAFGDYNIQVTHRNDEARTAIKVEGGAPVNRDINLVSAKEPAKLGEYTARQILATNDTLQYLVPAYNRIDRLDLAQNVARAINPEMGEFVSVAWITPTKAILHDINEQAFILDGTTATQTPYEIKPGTVSVLPDGTIAYADFEGVKVRSSLTGNPLYSLKVDASAPGLALGAKNRLFVYETSVAPRTLGGTTPQPTIYEGEKKMESATALLKDFIIGGAAWSPNGETLVFTSTRGIYALTIATNQLTELYGAQSTHSGSLKWVDDQTLLYYLDTKLWRIDLPTETWSKIASITQSLSTNDTFALSPDKKNIYFSVDADASGYTGALFRIKLD